MYSRVFYKTLTLSKHEKKARSNKAIKWSSNYWESTSSYCVGSYNFRIKSLDSEDHSFNLRGKRKLSKFSSKKHVCKNANTIFSPNLCFLSNSTLSSFRDKKLWSPCARLNRDWSVKLSVAKHSLKTCKDLPILRFETRSPTSSSHTTFLLQNKL